MRKVFLFMMTSLDGFFEGPNHELDWHNVDKEFVDFAINQLKEIDAILFGRVTYQMMAGFWPTKEAKSSDPVTAGFMNKLPKFVFSRTLNSAEWNNTTLVSGDAAEKVRELKSENGKSIAIFGSSDLTVSLIENGLVDEIRIMVNPMVLGRGKQLFKGISNRMKFALVSAKTFNSGNVLLCYKPMQ